MARRGLAQRRAGDLEASVAAQVRTWGRWAWAAAHLAARTPPPAAPAPIPRSAAPDTSEAHRSRASPCLAAVGLRARLLAPRGPRRRPQRGPAPEPGLLPPSSCPGRLSRVPEARSLAGSRLLQDGTEQGPGLPRGERPPRRLQRRSFSSCSRPSWSAVLFGTRHPGVAGTGAFPQAWREAACCWKCRREMEGFAGRRERGRTGDSNNQK